MVLPKLTILKELISSVFHNNQQYQNVVEVNVSADKICANKRINEF